MKGGRGALVLSDSCLFIGRTVQLEQRNQAMNYFIGVLLEKMREAGIYTVLVKGQGVAQCYERPLWRACGDVDFFLDDENYERAKGLLTPLAASVEEEYVREKHLGMTIDPWVVELHGRLYSGMRQICDWCRLLYTFRESLDYGLLESRIRRAGLMTAWKAFYALAVFYLGLPFTVDGLLLDSEQELERYRRKADRIMEFVLMSGNFGHNRDHSYFEKYPYLVRKCVSFGRRVGDLARHARIFPLDLLRFFPRIMWNGIRSAVNGE